MYFIKSIFLLLFITVASSVGSGQPAMEKLKVEFIWEDDFTVEEKQKIESWLGGVSKAISETFGPYPFTVKLYIHRTQANEPVPWAETARDEEQAVHFFVDPGFFLEDFQMDWTAAHEISHLSIPFVGRQNMWFSEGYASYWQWQVLEQQGMYSSSEIFEKYAAKMELIKPYYNTENSFLDVANKAKATFNYPVIYWGGACYFFQVDALLKKDYHSSLKEVLRKYQKNGRVEDKNLDDLISSLDEISKSTIFSKMLYKFQHGPAKEAVWLMELTESN